MGVKDLIGKEYPAFTHTVDTSKIRELADALDDPNPIYRDDNAAKEEGYEGLIASPTYPTALTFRPDYGTEVPTMGVLMDEIKIDIAKLLHGVEEYEYFKPIRPGMKLTCKSKIIDHYEKSGKSGIMDFYIFETIANDEKNEKVVASRTTMIVRR